MLSGKRTLDEMVDVALEESFPASDPPFFMAGTVVVGGTRKPRRRKDREAGDSVSEKAKTREPDAT